MEAALNRVVGPYGNQNYVRHTATTERLQPAKPLTKSECNLEVQSRTEGTHVVTADHGSPYATVIYVISHVLIPVGMAEIHAGTAAGVDHAVFPLRGGALARVRLDRNPSPRVAVRLA